MSGLIEKIKNNKLFQSCVFQSAFFRQFLKFGIIGLTNTILFYILYLVFLGLFKHIKVFAEYDYLISSVMAFFISAIWSFYWNNKYTFKNSDGVKRSLLKTFIKSVLSYSITGLLLQNVLLYVLVEFCGLPKEIVPLLILMITVPLNFILNKYWAFNQRD